MTGPVPAATVGGFGVGVISVSLDGSRARKSSGLYKDSFSATVRGSETVVFTLV